MFTLDPLANMLKNSSNMALGLQYSDNTLLLRRASLSSLLGNYTNFGTRLHMSARLDYSQSFEFAAYNFQNL